MLNAFLISHRDSIIAGARERIACRVSPLPRELEIRAASIPIVLDHLAEALLVARPRNVNVIDHERHVNMARRHGQDLLQRGLSIEQVVSDYQDICRVITELALRTTTAISVAQFRSLDLCLHDAIAGAIAVDHST